MKTKSNIIVTVCSFCGIIIGTKDAQGARGGLSHTECSVCHPYNLERIKLHNKLRKLSSENLLSNADEIKRVSKRIESINKILTFRKYVVEYKVSNKSKGLKIRFAREGKIKIKLHYKDEDSIILKADTIEEIRKKGKEEMKKRGWNELDCWSEQIKEGG